MTINKRKSRQKRCCQQISKRTQKTGWNTSDADEIMRRQLRAEAEIIHVEPLNHEETFYNSYIVYSDAWIHYDNAKYLVEIRSLDQYFNSCNCLDFQINGLGTCKHIESVLLYLRKRGKRKFKQAMKDESPWIEIFLCILDGESIQKNIRIQWPLHLTSDISPYYLLDQFFSSNGFLIENAITTVPILKNTIGKLDDTTKNNIRLSAHIDEWLQQLQKEQHKKILYDNFIKDLQLGKRTLNFLKHTLYPYQQEGVLHLAFKERALLADEMGLGKTAQAIGACELLRQLKNIKTVLVIVTASIKAEWEEQIIKFTHSTFLVIQGNKRDRLEQYKRPSFYYLTNYEQILYDGADIQRLMMPDVIILDEAQRIKNWQTKTAINVKRLSSPYAFVLTGTPLENRIDDIYSIVQFLNPELFGTLFRFNRQFYQLDEKGLPVGYKNLDELHHRLKPILLRRRKSDVEDQLPEKTVKHYFVAMDDEQVNRYSEYEAKVSRLLAQAKKRSLLKEEFEKLQKWLACMRMLCDSPFILDENCRLSPKINELEKILEEMLLDPTTKIIIFSEWARMLILIRDLADAKQIGYAWHTGSVPQQKRRQEIDRFKQNADCRLFLSTDSGSVGLNLQVANVVINIDLPWNPAKLEQRIARAWRKHQKKNVYVINLVSENSIEHRMIHLLTQKEVLATNVLNDGKIKEMEVPSSKVAFIEQLAQLMDIPQTLSVEQPIEVLRNEKLDEEAALSQFKLDTLTHAEEQLFCAEIYQNTKGEKTVFTVTKNSKQETKQKIQQHFESNKLDRFCQLEMIDQDTYAIIKQLAQAGVISINQNIDSLFESSSIMETRKQQQATRIKQSRKLLEQNERKYCMAKLLIGGDFFQEAIPSLKEALDKALLIYSYLNNLCDNVEEATFSVNLKDAILNTTQFPKHLLLRCWQIIQTSEPVTDIEVKEWLSVYNELVGFIEELFNKMSLI